MLSFLKTILIILFLAVIGIYGCITHKYHEWQLKRIPESINATRILYNIDESSGFGPGGNESGVIVYELPENAYKRIQKDGLTYLATTTKGSRTPGPWEIYYEDKWRETPLFFKDNYDGTTGASIYIYLDRYGVGVSVDRNVITAINETIAHPGSFYIHGRYGMLIIAPKIKRIFYVYSG